MLAQIVQTLFKIALLFYYMVEAIVKPFVPLKYRAKDVTGQIALVTGAGGGIGRLLSLKLAALGCRVVCWDVAKQANEETVRQIKAAKGEAFGYYVDLTKREDIYRTAELVKTEIGKVEILVNNAGVVTGKSLLDCPDEQILRTFDVNILAHFWTVKSFLPDMIMQDKGHIVTVASLAGMNGINRLVDYCSSKFAAVGFDEALRAELQIDGRNGVKTTVICPYFVKTPLFEGIDSRILPVLEPEEVAESTIKAILTDEMICIIPGYCNFVQMVKALLPTKALLHVIHAFGLGDTMSAFQGPKTKYN
jgi:all-trans-retinol dehydrogenase (NAD+)